MEFSEKDAARSKFKLSQKHRRGRGRGPGGTGRGGRGGRGRAAAAALDLGTNEDRYFDEAAEQASAAAALGPVRQSQGADLAELLSQAEPFDQAYYYRARVNLAQEAGLPPVAQEAYQGLSIDLKGLAACLELLPKNQLLDTDAFSDDEPSGDEWPAEEEELPDLEEDEEQVVPAIVASSQAATVAVSQHQQPAATAAAAAAEPETVSFQRAAGAAAAGLDSVSAATAKPAAASTAAAPDTGHQAGVDDLLSELLGEKVSIAEAQSSAAAQQAQQPGAPAQRLAAAGIGSHPATPAAAGLGSLPSQAHAASRQATAAARGVHGSTQQKPAVEDHDDELDALLGLPAPAAKQPVGQQQPNSKGSVRPPPAAQSQSLEDWLEGL